MAKSSQDSTSSFEDFFAKRLEEITKARAKEVKQFVHPVYNYSTGIIPLDYAINPHNPGILGGNIIQFAGAGGGGKTTLTLNIIRRLLKKGGKAIYCDAEDGLEDSLLDIFGITKYGTPGFTYVHNLKTTDYFTLIRDALMGLQGEPDPVIIVTDSISYMRPPVENFETVRVGDNIPFFNNFLRAIRPLVGNTNALVILINGVYQDNENKYNDYKIPGGETLKRACDLILVNYKRQNPGKPTAAEAHSFEVSKGLFIPYRQKLGVKIIKNKWYNADCTLSKLDYMFNLDKRFGPPGLDNINAMLDFLKTAGVLTGQGYYTLGDLKLRWADWEEQARNDPEIHKKLIEATTTELNRIFKEKLE